MPGRYNDRDSYEEVYIERRHSESPVRKAAPPHFAPIYYGERHEQTQRGRSSVSSQGSTSSRRNRDAELVRYEERHSRSESVDSDRSRRSSRRSSKKASNSNAVGPYIAPCSTDCADAPARRNSAKKPVSHPIDEDPYFDSADEAERQKKARNKQLLYTGLAAVTTIAATNNIYQSTKAHKAREIEVREGVMCESEAKRKRNKALAMDLFSVGVGAICVNNAVNGWKKTKAMRAEEMERRERWESHERDYRRNSMATY